MKSLVKEHFDEIADNYDYYKRKNKFYYDNLKKLLKTLIPKGKRVLEIGCGTGDLLFAVDPKKGVGIDISEKMINIAKEKYKKENNLEFNTKKVNSYKKGEFDFIFMSDVIEHLENAEKMFADVAEIMDNDTRFIITMANPKWEPILIVAEKMKLKMPEGKHYRRTYEQTEVLLKNAGLNIVKHDFSLLLPIYIPLVSKFVNNFVELLFKRYAFIEYVVAENK